MESGKDGYHCEGNGNLETERFHVSILFTVDMAVNRACDESPFSHKYYSKTEEGSFNHLYGYIIIDWPKYLIKINTH
jgi:hypothetical protein